MSHVLIIAEAGINHNGNIELAKTLIDKAIEAKADAIKFQTFKAQNVVCKNSQKAAYQMKTTLSSETQYEMLKKLELKYSDFQSLAKYSEEKGILLLSSPFDLESIDLLNQLGMEIFKIPSGEITNYPYLKKIGALKKKVIVSTGMSDLEEVTECINLLKGEGTTDITVLHCNTEYPTPMKDVNLKAMLTIKNQLHVPVGYSDHTAGIEVSIAAVAMGAEIIEKHFTLDKNMEGPDHKASLSFEELKEMIQCIRNIEVALGDGIKVQSLSEGKNKLIVRKSIVAKKHIAKGEVFTEDNLTTKRPGDGLSPMLWNEVIGKQASKDFEEEELIYL